MEYRGNWRNNDTRLSNIERRNNNYYGHGGIQWGSATYHHNQILHEMRNWLEQESFDFPSLSRLHSYGYLSNIHPIEWLLEQLSRFLESAMKGLDDMVVELLSLYMQSKDLILKLTWWMMKRTTKNKDKANVNEMLGEKLSLLLYKYAMSLERLRAKVNFMLGMLRSWEDFVVYSEGGVFEDLGQLCELLCMARQNFQIWLEEFIMIKAAGDNYLVKGPLLSIESIRDKVRQIYNDTFRPFSTVSASISAGISVPPSSKIPQHAQNVTDERLLDSVSSYNLFPPINDEEVISTPTPSPDANYYSASILPGTSVSTGTTLTFEANNIHFGPFAECPTSNSEHQKYEYNNPHQLTPRNPAELQMSSGEISPAIRGDSETDIDLTFLSSTFERVLSDLNQPLNTWPGHGDLLSLSASVYYQDIASRSESESEMSQK